MPSRSETRNRCTRAALIAALPGAFTMLARADEPAAPETPLAVHGYLSQAFAAGWNHQVLGIPIGGTADYRTAAVQL